MAFSPRLFVAIGVAIMSALMAGFIRSQMDSNHRCSLLHSKHVWLVSKRVVTPEGIISAAVEIYEGKIASVLRQDRMPKHMEGHLVMDYENFVIMPGLIDVHVHLNEPGRVEWEGFETGTKAAAAGGVTTLIDMPLNSVPTTTTREAFQMKVSAAEGKLYVDIGFWGGLVPENAFNATALTELLQSGVLGLKSFMCPSGFNDFLNTNSSHIKEALRVLSHYKRPLLVHAEVPQSANEDALSTDLDKSRRRMYSTYLERRPPSWEVAAITELAALAKEAVNDGALEGSHIHIVHLSDAGTSLDLINEAKELGANISVETCPHYLSFSSEEIMDGDTRFKCAPPIRDSNNKEQLWRALKEGDIDMLSSDHSPSSPELKLLDEGDFLGAWGGISSLQFNLAASWSSAKNYGLGLDQISELWSVQPSKLAGLKSKGAIVAGNDADIVVWDPESKFLVNENYTIHHKHDLTAYAGRELYGEVISTFVRGNLVYEKGKHVSVACGVPILAV